MEISGNWKSLKKGRFQDLQASFSKQFSTDTWDWSVTDLTQWEQNCVGNLTQSCALAPLNKLMSLHGTVHLCAANKLSFQRSSKPFISLLVEQSSFTAICLIIKAELAWWPLPCVWLYQRQVYSLEVLRKCFGECICSSPISDNEEPSFCNHFCMG